MIVDVTSLRDVTYSSAEARQQLLDDLERATNQIGLAVAALSAAYEQLDERSGDRLEEELFRPVQLAYGRARRTHSGFASRSGLPSASFEPAAEGLPSTGVKGLIDQALESVERADAAVAEMQDSMLPVEVGDGELREGLSETRELLQHLRGHAREFVRTLGR